MRDVFFEKGWCRFPDDPVLLEWTRHVLPAARSALESPENAEWIRCGGTWNVGVNALPNDAQGKVGDGPELGGDAIGFIRGSLGMPPFDLDRAQVSVCYPGYPQPMDTETPSAYQFRLKKDAAHVDGLRREGPSGHRFLREFHGFVLGIPLVSASADAAPLVVWEGSHEIMREGFKRLFDGMTPDQWGNMDITKPYQAMRRQVMESCKRVAIPASPGQSYIVHRLALHGMAPWAEQATAGPDGRMIAYFRPDFGVPSDWLFAP